MLPDMCRTYFGMTVPTIIEAGHCILLPGTDKEPGVRAAVTQ